MMQKKMSKLLSSLNSSQREATEKIFGPVLVLAGPGTGKTHLLTTRIVYLLEQNIGADPQNILCLTFTDSAAVEMRNRLQKWIGPTSYRIKISTFHSFCEFILDEFPEYFESVRKNRRIADDIEKALAFQEVMKTEKWEKFFSIWDEFQFRNDLLKTISDLKRENISPENFLELIPEEKRRLEEAPENFYKKKYGEFNAGEMKPGVLQKIEAKEEKMREFARFWKKYEEIMEKNGWYDFDDQIMWVVREIKKNENLRLDLAEKFQWIMVDEYQDTNSSQNELLWALTDFQEDPNIFVVGDDDQAIYRFQGASRKNIDEFLSRFPRTEKIALTENYRSAQNILDTAFTTIQKNLDRVDPDRKLFSAGENKNFPGTISKAVFASRYAEIGFLVHQIREELSNGFSPNQISILVRENREVLEIARELPKFGLPVSAQIFQDIFRDPFVRILILMLEFFSSPDADENIMELLNSPFWKIPSHNIMQYSIELNNRRKEERLSTIEFILEKSETDEELKKAINILVLARKNYTHCRPEIIAEKLLYESGLAGYIARDENDKKVQEWQIMRKFLEWIELQEADTVEKLLERIYLHQKLKIPVRPDPIPADRNAIQILTSHKAKGREFDIVFIPGLLDGVWGNKRSYDKIPIPHLFKKEKDEGNADERRLFFVALTRARKKVFLSYASTDFSGKEKSPSEFFHEVPDSFCKILKTDEIESQTQKLIPVLLSANEKILLTSQEKEILKSQVENFVWSVSSLQNYLDCPRKFLYQNIIRLPRKASPHMALGSSLHEALEEFMREYKRQKRLPPQEYLLEQYKRSLRRQNVETIEFENLLIYGQNILTEYLNQKKETLVINAEFEFDFNKFSPSIDGIRITGKMDKVVFLNEEKTRAKIVDYKSGKPKAIKEGGNYWRQLVFYDLLARNSKGISWQVEECEIEFLTPDPVSGKLSTRSLYVSDQDREQVINELKSSHTALQNLEFPIIPNPEFDEEIEFWQNFGKQ